MDADPDICLQVEEIHSREHWRSAIVETTCHPRHRAARNRWHSLQIDRGDRPDRLESVKT